MCSPVAVCAYGFAFTSGWLFLLAARQMQLRQRRPGNLFAAKCQPDPSSSSSGLSGPVREPSSGPFAACFSLVAAKVARRRSLPGLSGENSPVVQAQDSLQTTHAVFRPSPARLFFLNPNLVRRA